VSARRIVVGLHNTEAARRALRWAHATATRSSAALEVITAFRSVTFVPMDWWAVVTTLDVPIEAMSDFQAQMLYTELGSAARSPLIAAEVLDCEPGEALNDASIGAELLVLGLRTRRIGQLTQAPTLRVCSKGARCPIVVVRDDLEVPVSFDATERPIATSEAFCRARPTARDRARPTRSQRVSPRGCTRNDVQ
jgi:nucleotide-binding universal stress UspA family protein